MQPDKLPDLTKDFLKSCKDCGVCTSSCFFLQEYGSPIEILKSENAADIVYSCTGCGLCSKVCPFSLDPSSSFHELKKYSCENGKDPHKTHSSFLNYERFGQSFFSSIDYIPDGSDSVFYPGCSFSGRYPDLVLDIYSKIKRTDKNAALVLDCCSSPSHSLGYLAESFDKFIKKTDKLRDAGVSKVYLACPNCFLMFKRYAPDMEIKMVFSFFLENRISPFHHDSMEMTIHDPCVLRGEGKIHSDIRDIASSAGINIIESDHVKSKSVCCGNGAGLSSFDPELSLKWKNLVLSKSGKRKILTYCAGCRNKLGENTIHIMELFYPYDKRVFVRFTYLARILLKLKLASRKIYERIRYGRVFI